MNTSKCFLSTLIAAAAMSANAWADVTVVNTTKDIVDAGEMSGVLKLAGVNGNGPGTANILVSGTLDAIIHTNSDSTTGAMGTVNVGSESVSVVVASGRVEMGDLSNSNGSNLNIGKNSSLVVSGGNNTFTSTWDYKTASIVLGEWGTTTTANIFGNFLAKDAIVFPGDTGMILNVSGGVFAVKGIGSGVRDSSKRTLNLSGGGKIILGESGITNARGSWSCSLGEGTIGISAGSTTIDAALTVTDGTNGTTFDTTLYSFTGEGTAQTISQGQGATGGTIKLAGGINGPGLVKIVGAGTVELGGTIALSSAIQNSGSVTVASDAVFVLDGLTANEQGVYTVIDGGTIDNWSALGFANFSLGSGFWARGSSVSVDGVSAGQVSVVAGEAADLVWSGGSSGTWDVQASQNWLNDGKSDTFYSFDNVKFDTTADITVASALSAGNVTIEGEGTVVTLSGAKISASEGFVVKDGATFKLGGTNIISGTVIVGAGGTFDINGNSDGFSFDGGAVVLNGGTLVNSGEAVGISKRQLSSLTLTADSTIGGDVQFGIVGSGHAATTTDLGGHTLTKTGKAEILFANNTLKNGTLDVSAGGISDGGKSLTIGENATLKVSGGNLNVTGTFTNNGTLEFATDYTYGGIVSGGGALKVSSGTLIWTGKRNSQGVVTVESGATLDVTGGSIFDVQGHVSNGRLVVQGRLKLADSAWGEAASLGKLAHNKDKVFIDGGEIIYTTSHTAFRAINVTERGGKITANSGVDIIFAGNNGDGSDNAFITGGGVLEFNAIGNISVKAGDKGLGYISGSAAIKKTGSGTLTLSGDNKYSGGTTISQGTLVAAHANALGTGAVKVLSGATLQADVAVELSGLTLVVSDKDVITSAVIAADAGEASGLVTGNGGVTVNKLVVDVKDLSSAESVVLKLAAGTALSADQIELGSSEGDTWTTYGTWVNNQWNGSITNWYIQGWDAGNLTLAIPEPSTFGLLAGLGALTLVGTRRRRKKA